MVMGLMLASLGLLLSACGSQKPVQAAAGRPDVAKNVYIVTHIDVMPNFSDGANKAIQKYADESRKDAGAISVEGLVQDGRPNHFTIMEWWRDRAALEAHSGQAHTKEFRDTLQPMLGAPFDERLHEPLP